MQETDNKDTNRGAKWFTLLTFSIIALVSLLTDVEKVSSEQRPVKWSVSAISISLALSALAVIAGVLLKTKFIGTLIEGGLSLLVLIFWAAVMPALMKPENTLAVNEFNLVGNSNLYFFSWLSLITSLVIFVDYLRTTYNIGTGTNESFNPALWAGLCMASFVVLTSGTRTYQGPSNCDSTSSSFCKRTKFAVALGVISAVLSFTWMILGAKVPIILDALLSVVLLIAWIFGIIFITFGGENAPGAELGNLYFSTWAGFIISVMLAGRGLARMLHKDDKTETTEGAAVPGEEEKDKPVEEEDVTDEEHGKETENINL